MNYLLFASQAYSIAILRPLQQAIIEQEHNAAWFLYNLPGTVLNNEEIRLETIEQVKQFNPRAVFVPGNWVPDFFPGLKVEIFHGFGIEKKGHFDIRGFFDLYCTHGPATTSVFNKLQNQYGYFTVKETGWPKIDPLFKKPLPPAEEKQQMPTILYAPTFSPSLTSANELLKPIKQISQQRQYKWLIKFHPKMPNEIIEQYRQLESDKLTISDSNDIIPLLHQADIMLSDTSSVIAEFLLLHKPVMTYNNRQPGPHIINIQHPDELNGAIQIARHLPDKLLTAIKDFISNMHPYRDGNSSQRVLQAVEEAIQNPPEKKKPLNLWRKLQVRKRLSYFHIK